MTRKTWAVLAAGVLTALVVTAGVVITTAPRQQALAAQPSPVQTAQVERRTLAATIAQPGTLTYVGQSDGSPYSVINQARGTYTQLPGAGSVIVQGHVLYRVDGSPVVLLRGSTPAYRTLAVGATGTDVGELNADLVGLGYASRTRLSPRSRSFGTATSVALAKLQAAAGIAQTGTLALGQAVFEPVSLRVTAVSAQLGGAARPGQTVLQATSTTRQVQLALDASQQTDVAVGDRVTITLPNNHLTSGAVASVATVATCPSSSGSAGPNSGSPTSATDTCSSSSSGSTAPTITVGVTPSHPAATGKWDEAPVQVGITTDRVRDALVVPVTALMARAQGGYGVEVVGAGGSHHLVPVSLGLFDDADGLVQVAGPGLAAGQAVVVPAT